VGASARRIKAFLLDQARIAGIGNAYIHDYPLPGAAAPLRKIDSLSGGRDRRLAPGHPGWAAPEPGERRRLYEMDTYGQKGGFTLSQILVGSRRPALPELLYTHPEDQDQGDGQFHLSELSGGRKIVIGYR
jgi:hypothetical protein